MMFTEGRFTKVWVYGTIVLFLIWTLLPLYWMLITALKPLQEFFTYPPTFWPSRIETSNLYLALVEMNGLRAMKDTIIIVLGTLVVSLGLGVPMAYSIARYGTGGDHLSFTVLSFRFMPPIVPVVALFALSTRVGLFDTYWLLILVNSMANIPFVVWIMKGFFEEIPYAIEEAAQVDGASWVRVMRNHILPLSAPGLVATTLFVFIFTWNELLFAVILTGRNILPYGKLIPALNIGVLEPHWGAMSALGLVTVIPIVLLAFYMQRYIVRGVTYGAVRE